MRSLIRIVAYKINNQGEWSLDSLGEVSACDDATLHSTRCSSMIEMAPLVWETMTRVVSQSHTQFAHLMCREPQLALRIHINHFSALLLLLLLLLLIFRGQCLLGRPALLSVCKTAVCKGLLGGLMVVVCLSSSLLLSFCYRAARLRVI